MWISYIFAVFTIFTIRLVHSQTCTNVPPPDGTGSGNFQFSCFQQAIIFQKCGEAFMASNCNYSCGRCEDYTPPSIPKCNNSYRPKGSKFKSVRAAQDKLTSANKKILNWFESASAKQLAKFYDSNDSRKRKFRGLQEVEYRGSIKEFFHHHTRNRTESIAASIQATTQAVTSIIKRSGTRFFDGSSPWFASGTNAYYASILNLMTPAQIDFMWAQQAHRGVTVSRVFAFNFFNTYGTWPQLGGPANQAALVQLDRVLASARDNGIRVILVLSNFEPFLGGIEEWVAQKYPPQVTDVSTQYPRELFFTDSKLRCQFRDYMKVLTSRVNTINGQPYTSDATILAWELQNEPKTTDGFEDEVGLTPGSITCNWVKEQSSYLKTVLKVQQMIAVGDEGYLTTGPTNIGYAFLNNGIKGGNFQCNLKNKYIDFGTLHVYPNLWGVSTTDPGTNPLAYDPWVGTNFISSRKQIADDIGKPIILEEYGSAAGYVASRDILFSYLQSEANRNNFASTLVWAVSSCENAVDCPQYGADGGQFVFGWPPQNSDLNSPDYDGYLSIEAQNDALAQKKACYQQCWSQFSENKQRNNCARDNCDGIGISS